LPSDAVLPMITRSIAHPHVAHSATGAPAVEWLPWSRDAFALASREHKPVLLSITAAWCRACRDMDLTTYAAADVGALVHDRFVAVRVDADRRPDINDRYNLGGWPTTAFLTPEGELLGGGTFVGPDRMPSVLAQVADAMATRGSEIARARMAQEGRSAGAAGSPELSDAAAIDAVFATFDEESGGFGLEPKFPLAAPLHLALALYRETTDARWRSVVERTLDAMSEGAIHDVEEGGFYRYARARDWQAPEPEKLLDTNAALLRVYVDAGVQLGNDRYLAAAGALVSFITTRLASTAGGYRGSEDDPIVYTDSSAAASAALLAAGAALGDTGLGQDALQSLERVLLASYRPGLGVAHYIEDEPRVRGLLADQVSAMHALLDAQEAAGGEPYGMMAGELAHYMLRVLDGAAGGFLDRQHEPDDMGLLQSRRTPFVANCEAARGLARLARLSGNQAFRVRAEAALQSVSRDAIDYGPLVAHFLLARRELTRHS
jgi:uncharacterized protein YyaL (SSP411 family)